MKVIKQAVKPQPAQPTVRGAVVVQEGVAYMECGLQGTAPYVVNLETGQLIQSGTIRDSRGEIYPNAALLLDGVQPLPVPPYKSALQHAQEFLKWGYDNPNKSQFSSLTIYTPGEVLEGRTNANVRRQWQTWLAARGV